MGRPDRPQTFGATFVSLEPRVRHVSEATIRKKWKKLPSSNHDAARELILSAKEQSRGRKGKAGIDAATEDCVQEVADKLSQKLPRIPFPQGTDENHFDHEANLSRISKIEEQLTANIHSVNLLRAQIAKEEELLKQDETDLDHLQQSLQSSEVFRRQQSRTLHPTARKLVQKHGALDLHALEDENRKEPEPCIADLFQDAELEPLLLQLQNHLDSLHNNIAPIKKVTKVIEKRSLDLESFAFSTLDTEKYRKAAGIAMQDQT